MFTSVEAWLVESVRAGNAVAVVQRFFASLTLSEMTLPISSENMDLARQWRDNTGRALLPNLRFYGPD